MSLLIQINAILSYLNTLMNLIIHLVSIEKLILVVLLTLSNLVYINQFDNVRLFTAEKHPRSDMTLNLNLFHPSQL